MTKTAQLDKMEDGGEHVPTHKPVGVCGNFRAATAYWCCLQSQLIFKHWFPVSSYGASEGPLQVWQAKLWWASAGQSAPV